MLIGGFCYRSSAVSNGILLSTGLHLSRENLEKAGVGTLITKLFSEVINKMRVLQIDVSEWGCLRAIMLFAPGTIIFFINFVLQYLASTFNCFASIKEFHFNVFLRLSDGIKRELWP